MEKKEKSMLVACESKTALDKMYYALKMETLMQEMKVFNSCIDMNEFMKSKKFVKMGQEDRCLRILAYYALYGFTRDTVEECRKAFNMNANRINQLNHNLTKKGYLERHKYNNTLRDIPKFVLDIRDVVLSGGILGVKFDERK